MKNKDLVLMFINEYRYRIQKLELNRGMKDLLETNLHILLWLEEISYFNEPIILLEEEYKSDKEIFHVERVRILVETKKYWKKFYETINKNNFIGISDENVMYIKEAHLDINKEYVTIEYLYRLMEKTISEMESNESLLISKLQKEKLIKEYQDSRKNYLHPIYWDFDDWKDMLYYSYAYNDTSPSTSLMVIKNPLYDAGESYELEKEGESYDDIFAGQPAEEDDVDGIANMLIHRHGLLSEFFFDYYIENKRSEYLKFRHYLSAPELSQYRFSYIDNILICEGKGKISFGGNTQYGKILELLFKDNELDVSFKEAKELLPKLILNDFHRYKKYINDKFMIAKQKGKISIRLELIKDIFDKRGNPALKLTVMK